MSQAPNNLLKQGAKLITDVSDVLEELEITIAPKKSEELTINLSPVEKQIFQILKEKPTIMMI
ncbi:MAG: hypothetical protein NZL96_04005 [Patescibacteria group bacterium]|nr:hypothetical protein [Patescibacteria group bacterium]